MVLESDLPLLNVSVPDKFSTKKINLNDDLQINISYYKSPDEVFYSLLYIYKFDIVATKKFKFTSFRFKIWDMFNNFDESNNNLLLRISL